MTVHYPSVLSYLVNAIQQCNPQDANNHVPQSMLEQTAAACQLLLWSTGIRYTLHLLDLPFWQSPTWHTDPHIIVRLAELEAQHQSHSNK